MSRCLVTGGAGFIGSHVVDALISSEHEVTVVDNESSSSHDSFYWNKKSDNHRFNLCDYSKTAALFREKKPEYVFHLAAYSNIQEAIQNPRRTLENNFSSTMNVLDCTWLYGGKRLIFSSSASVYGSLDPPLTESLAPDPLNPYAASKVMGENAVRSYYKVYGLGTVSLRYFNVYGERQPVRGAYVPVIGTFLDAKDGGRSLKIYGDGLQERDFIYVGDVARYNILCAFSDNKEILGGIINIGTGESHSILDIAKAVDWPIEFEPGRTGEVRTSRADTNRLKKLLKSPPEDRLKNWIKNQNVSTATRQESKSYSWANREPRL
jgi:UDP-glucose 4-epimerase